MNVTMVTRGDWASSLCSAKTQHQDDCAVLTIANKTDELTFYGAANAKEAFDKIADIFNEAHPPTPKEPVVATPEDDFPF